MAAAPIDLPAVIDSLPRDHALVLRGALAGFAADDLAHLAGVPVEALLPLLRLAAAKLDRALADAAGASPPLLPHVKISGSGDSLPHRGSPGGRAG